MHNNDSGCYLVLVATIITKMASDNDSDNSGATIAIEDDSFFDSVLGPDELNLSLYQFDEKK